jgi:hypothetical protein
MSRDFNAWEHRMRDLFGCGSPVGSISTVLADKLGKESIEHRIIALLVAMPIGALMFATG